MSSYGSSEQIQPPPMMPDAQYIETMRLNPFPQYRKMRMEHPVFYNQANNWWEVFRYNDILTVVNDTATYSSERFLPPDASQDSSNASARSILNMDPPHHHQLRDIISQAFTPRAVTQLTPRITSIVNELLRAVVTRGYIDVVKDLAGPLPLILLTEMLGIPAQDREQLKLWAHTAVNSTPMQSLLAFQHLDEYFKRIIARYRAQPGENLISALLKAQVEDQHLSEAEIVNFCVLLLFAGNETLTNLIANTLLCLDEYPAAMALLRSNLTLLPSALEEVMRYLSPVQLLVRASTVDTVLSGQKLKAGQVVFLWTGSANRDEAQFADPEVFAITRTPNRHIAFGHGIHFCLGAPLARLAAKITLGILLERFSTIKRVPDVPLKPSDNIFVYGVKSLPITLR
jgi:cytochrome P450